MEHKNSLGINVNLRLLPTIFPIFITTSASAVKKFKGPAGSCELRKRLYHKVERVGVLEVPKMSEASVNHEIDHPDAGLEVVTVRVGMKLPDILPQDYAMCEIMVETSFLARKENFQADATAAVRRVGSFVQNSLDEVARLCGGEPPFTKAQTEAAERTVAG